MAHKLRRTTLDTTNTTRTEAAARSWADATQAALTVQPARWIAATRPRWVALEQVPAVAPLWQIYARELRRLGYSTWTGVLNAADYGVPQTRRRAILLASLDRAAGPPVPTHAEGGADTLFGTLAPWVSMADALGWVGENGPARTVCGGRSPRWMYPDPDGTRGRMVGFPRRADNGDQVDGYRRRDFRTATEPAGTITARHRSAVVLRAGAQDHATVRGLDEPAPTVVGSWDNGDTRWVVRTGANSMVTGRTGSRAGHGDVQPYERPIDQPAPTVDTKTGSAWTLHTNRDQRPDGSRQTVTDDRPSPTLSTQGNRWTLNRRQQSNGTPKRNLASDEPAPTLTGIAGAKGQWVFERPATTVVGDGRAFGPHAGAAGEPQSTNAVHLSIGDALTLQSFPAGYPLQGTRTQQFQQVGNAVPPRMAAHLMAALTGRQLDLDEREP